MQILRSILLICVASSFSIGQIKTIRGVVRDAQTHEALPLANIQIAGTLKGAISNREGRYELHLQSLPATIQVRYIGYKSQSLTITASSPDEIPIELEPNPVEFSEIVITGEDPGMRLMRGVMTKKRQWKNLLRTFEADAYSRMTLSNDTMIVMMLESISTVYWDHKRGIKEIVRTKRQTANVDSGALFSVASGEDGIVNFYDDNIRIQGSEFIGPTHPDALDYYQFTLLKKRALDDKTIFEIGVKPRSLYQPLFTGTLSVIDEDSAMIEVHLKPHERVLFPPPIKSWDVMYRQQFRNFGLDFWLPVDSRQEGRVKIATVGLEFPFFRYQVITGLNEYRVNTELPDSLYHQKKKRWVDSVSLRNLALFDSHTAIIPLTTEESLAYTTIDSDLTFSKAFKPKGLLARFVRSRSRSERRQNTQDKGFAAWISRLYPDLWYNRVEGFHAGFGYEIRLLRDLTVTPKIGYATLYRQWAYGGEAKYRWGTPHRFRPKPWLFTAGFSNSIEPRYPSDIYSRFSNSLSLLLGSEDYFDYFKNRKIYLALSYDFRQWDIRSGLQIQIEQHHSVEKKTDYDLAGRKKPQRPNPAIDDGNLRSLIWQIGYGGDYIPFGIVSQRYILFQIEHSRPEWMNSDFHFTAYRLTAEWPFTTFFSRRFLANALILRMTAGTFSGKLPRQRFGVIESAQSFYMPFGTLRTNPLYPYEGEKYAAFFWEHHFRTVPFEFLGFDYIVKNNIALILFGGSGRTWISKERLQELSLPLRYTRQFHHEIGLSLSGFFDLFRLDIARRLDRYGWYAGISAARLF